MVRIEAAGDGRRSLSRRVGLAKSNVMRYFPSREAALLELLDALTREWLADLAEELPAAVSARAGFERRATESAKRGRLRGRGLACFLAWTGAFALSETLRLRVDARGWVAVVSGAQEMGQGHVRRAEVPEP